MDPVQRPAVAHRSHLDGESGSAAFQTLMAVLLLFMVLLVMVFAARLPTVATATMSAADAAARAASLAQTVDGARSLAQQTAQSHLHGARVPCAEWDNNISTVAADDGVNLEPGSFVTVTIRCRVYVADVIKIAPVPGSAWVDAVAVEIIDVHRTFE